MSDRYYGVELHPAKWTKEFIYEGPTLPVGTLPVLLRVNLDAPEIDKQKVINALTGLRDYIVGRQKWPPAP